MPKRDKHLRIYIALSKNHTFDKTEHIETWKSTMECDQQKAENKKSSRSEQGKSLGKEFTRALNLLYSREPKSADELREMLEIEIAKQNKPKRPKLRTYPRRNKRRKTNAVAVENGRSTVEKENNEIFDQKTAACDLDPDAFEYVGNRDDVPRISIPDEDQNDGAVCKVRLLLKSLIKHAELS